MHMNQDVESDRIIPHQKLTIFSLSTLEAGNELFGSVDDGVVFLALLGVVSICYLFC